MGKISEETQEKGIDFQTLVGPKGSKNCLITGKSEPKYGGFYQREKGTGFCVSSKAIENRDGNKGFHEFGITFGDAILDSGVPQEQYDDIIENILNNIENGMKYTINLHNRNSNH